jgi:hypothetical protein
MSFSSLHARASSPVFFVCVGFVELGVRAVGYVVVLGERKYVLEAKDEVDEFFFWEIF